MSEEQTVKLVSSRHVTFNDLEMLEGKGIYSLLFFVPVERRITVGCLGANRFPKGYYVYTGSALGRGAMGLGRRVLRHLREESKKKRWHIDYVLSGGNAEVTAVIATHTKKKLECEINRYLRDKLQAKIPIPGFGSSDCKDDCGSHLLYLGLNQNVAKRVAESYSEKLSSRVYVLYFYRSRLKFPARLVNIWGNEFRF